MFIVWLYCWVVWGRVWWRGWRLWLWWWLWWVILWLSFWWLKLFEIDVCFFFGIWMKVDLLILLFVLLVCYFWVLLRSYLERCLLFGEWCVFCFFEWLILILCWFVLYRVDFVLCLVKVLCFWLYLFWCWLLFLMIRLFWKVKGFWL